MKKRVLSLLLAITMCITMLPTMTFAAGGEADPKNAPIVWVGGQGMTASTDGAVVSYYTNGEPGTVTQTEPEEYHAKLYYDTANSVYTLELHGLDAVGIANDAASLGAGIYSTVPLTIQVKGRNTVSGATGLGNVYGIRGTGFTINGTKEDAIWISNPKSISSSYGFYSEGNVIVNDVTLDITMQDAHTGTASPGIYNAGIYVVGKLILNDANISTVAGTAAGQSAGIFVKSSESNASLYYTGGAESESGAGSSITPGDRDGSTTTNGGLTVNGGIVSATAGIAYGTGMSAAYSDGIYADGAITFNNAEITVKSDFGVQGIYAIDSYNSDVTINGGTVTAISGSGIPPANVTSDGRISMTFGIYAGNKFTLTAGEVNVTGSESRNNSYGIYAKKDITISGGELIVKAEQAGVQSAGLYTDNDLIIRGDASVNATAAMAGYRSYGIFVTNNFHMSGNPFVSTTSDITNYTSVGSSTRSAGLYMGDDRSENYTERDTFTITGGTLIANSIVTDESTATESYAVAMYNVENDELIFSDASQTNAAWYLWSIDSNGEIEHLSTSKPYVYKDTEENYKSPYLYIAPLEQTHTVTFYPRNGEMAWDVPVDDGETVEKPAPDPTYEGYRLVGWFTSDDDGATLAENPYDFDTPVTSDFNLYAKWGPITVPQTYTVTYDLNGGTGADGVNYDSETVEAGTNVTVKAAPTRDGCTFTGWSDGTATYQPGETLPVNSDITLTAQWSETTPENPNPNPQPPLIIPPITPAPQPPVTPAPQPPQEEAEHPGNDQVPEVFTDDHYAYIVGVDDGLVHPEDSITRAEVATIFFRLLNEETRAKYLTRENNFTDVSEDDWFCTAASTMAAMGIITGRPGGQFAPYAEITRVEFAAIAARFDDTGDSKDAGFTDIRGNWAEREINIAANRGWVLGYEGKFRPGDSITRAEAMTMVNRVLQRNPESKADLHPDMIQWPDNLDTTRWYYLHVQEATNGHDYRRRENGREYWTALREVPDWAALEQAR